MNALFGLLLCGSGFMVAIDAVNTPGEQTATTFVALGLAILGLVVGTSTRGER